MHVSPLAPFKLVYSIFEHEYLGYLFESFVVQLNAKGQLTLQTQNISSKNAKEFAANLDEVDFQLIKLMDAMQQDAVAKKFSQTKLKPIDFFLKVYDKNKPEKVTQELILSYIFNLRAKILPLLLQNKSLFIMSKDGDAIRTPVEILQKSSTILFHFMRNAENTHYFPTVKHDGLKVEFQYKNALIINDEPAWMILENKLYHFENEVDGKKLKPFLNKKFILIPKNIEEDYYRKFVTPLITMFDVYAKGFEIRNEVLKPKAVLKLSVKSGGNTTFAPTLFEKNLNTSTDDEDNEFVDLSLHFQYGMYSFRFDNFANAAYVKMEKNDENYLFHKVKRDLIFEKEKLKFIKSLNLDIGSGFKSMPKADTFMWIQANHDALVQAGIFLEQSEADGKKYFFGQSSIEDWFDILALVRFGDFEIPFIKLKNTILSKKKEFTLPNGEIAVIPEIWFTQYSDLLFFSELDQDTKSIILKKHHVGMVHDLGEEGLAKVVMSRKLEKLRDFEKIEETELPLHFNGTLRAYQKAGYDWMCFLQKYNLGGCLADDMGLGKTVQTLALLQKQKEDGARQPSLLIMPTSLVFNWELEAKKFAPNLTLMNYTGSNRAKYNNQFKNFDLVITSYGIARIDIEILKKERFNYIVLDESQSIKNPTANIAVAVMQLNSNRRLILTGTPLENSTMDIWSQMTFVNPGLLGTQAFFKNEYLLPIEKKGDEAKLKKLNSLIKPFILRRHKSQVAKELPPKVESVHYCNMTEEQEEIYEKEKAYYRNIILKAIDDDGMNKSTMMILQGLSKLRQIANHPKMVDLEYEGDSGKMEDLREKLNTITQEGHKVLVFSQFVKHLSIVKAEMDANGIAYAYLDGSTPQPERQKQVEIFQKNDEVKVFLISLKAGGLGLNLTAAEYVFILDPWWNPAVEAQAVDRAHRIGQLKTVFTYKMIAKNTVEEKILALQKSKLRLANSLINTEESFVKALTKDDILELLT
jgi:SNF2 family DNA or RNA helicase